MAQPGLYFKLGYYAYLSHKIEGATSGEYLKLLKKGLASHSPLRQTY